MLPKILPEVLEVYKPASIWESFYLRTRWRLCPYELVESLIPGKGKILDLGCGYGILANLLSLKSPSRSVVGIDLNDKRVGVAKRSVKNRKNIAFHCTAIENLKTTQYDAIVMTDVLHHIDETNVKQLLEIATSCLHYNGTLTILEVDRRPLWKFYFTYLIDRLLNPMSALHYRSMQGLIHLLEQFPLSIKKVTRSHKGLPLSDIIYFCKKNNA